MACADRARPERNISWAMGHTRVLAFRMIESYYATMCCVVCMRGVDENAQM